MPIPDKLKKILDKNNTLSVKSDWDLIRLFELTETAPNELTFNIYNYLSILNKNKKIKEKFL
jgi:hypothetical protein